MSDIAKFEYTPPGGSLTTVTMEFPPQGSDYKKKRLRAEGRTSDTADGTVQYITNHTEESRFLRFTHVTTAIKDDFETMFNDHVKLGRSFTFFEDKDAAATGVYTISRQQGRVFEPDPMGTKWKFTFRFRRTI